MEHVLFLDFDGVLHPGLAGTFVYRDRIEGFLAQHPSVGVVFSTSWREQYSVAEMASWFLGTPRERFLGATPILPSGPALRWHEIQAWLTTARFRGAWAALDDDRMLFPELCLNLVLCDPARGVRPAQLETLSRIFA